MNKFATMCQRVFPCQELGLKAIFISGLFGMFLNFLFSFLLLCGVRRDSEVKNSEAAN